MSEVQVDNGVNVAALLEARAALTEAPEAAKFQWRATCKWVNGTHSNSVVQGFFGLGEEQHHKTEFEFDADHPEIFASEDQRRYTGGICARWPGQLSYRGCGGGGAAS